MVLSSNMLIPIWCVLDLLQFYQQSNGWNKISIFLNIHTYLLKILLVFFNILFSFSINYSFSFCLYCYCYLFYFNFKSAYLLLLVPLISACIIALFQYLVSLTGACILAVISQAMSSPVHLPDLFTLMITTYSFVHFAAFLLFFHYLQFTS